MSTTDWRKSGNPAGPRSSSADERPISGRHVAPVPRGRRAGSAIEEHPSECAICAVRPATLFGEMEPSEIDERLRPIRSGFYPANQVIYREGESARFAFSIRAGVVKLVHEDADGAERVLRLLGRGAAIGLESFDGALYANTAIATREVNLCRIPRSVLTTVAQRSPSLYAGLARKWREHAMLSETWSARLHGGTLEVRATVLVRLLVDISGDPRDSLRLLRNDDMAALLGVSKETMSRCMASLKRRGLIKRIGPWTYDCRPLLSRAEGAGCRAVPAWDLHLRGGLAGT